MKKTIMALTAAGTLLIVGGVAATSVFAAEGTTQRDTIVSKIAEKLGISEDKVQTAFDESRDEVHTDMVAQREEDTQTALDSGDITERQYQIAEAMQEIREENFDSSTPRKGEFQGDMLDLLNEKGLDVTEDELQELRDVMRDLDLVGGPRGGGEMGMGRGMHR
jgi:hypothetical protein